MNQSAICIAGAHRSGTSMLTRLLHRSGLDLGLESDLMPAASDNPDGFWENLRFVQLNDEILNAVGAAWDLPPWPDESFDHAGLQPMRAKAELLIERFSDKPVWGWKDPRNCLTLPFWRSLLPGLKTIIIIRNPLEVAYSMHKRNGTSYALGLRLWEIYNRRLLAETSPDERVVAHYQAFFEEPEAELRKMATFAGLDSKEIAAAAALVAVNQRHTAFTIEQMIDAGVSEAIVALYRSLIDRTTQGSKGRKKNKRTSAVESDQLSGTESKLNTSVPNSEDVRRELAARRGDEAQHREEVTRLQRTIERLREELAAKSVRAAAEINRRDGRIEELQKAYAHIDQMLQGEQVERNRLLAEMERTRREFWEKEKHAQAQLEGALQQAARGAEELKNARERFAQTNQLLQKLSIRLTDFESRNASLTERLRKQLLEMKRLLRVLDQIDDAAILLRRSRRWKLANPMTALLAAMTGKTLPGFGHLDKNVERYRAWRANHPEMASLAEEIQALRPREIFPPFPTSEAESAAKPESAPALKPPPPTTPVSFAKHDQVEVSIVVPAYNQVDFTHACLTAVQRHSGEIPYEVIVVDDASTDATSEVIGKIPGIVYLHTETNSGFIASCNRGAAAARGNYLIFLNNDTSVTAGWLAALRETFEFDPDAGLVGSKLVYPDGRLQEAGGIIWRDGSGWNRGKFQDPAKPEYNYLREVDYCSAASVMIPKSLFDRLGGFDRKYAPAYYEDTDLAFKVKQSGRKVLYQPLSVVLHHEGITSGTDTSSGTKQYQEVNRATFATAWRAVLADKPENGDLVSYESAKPGKKRILIIDHHLPMPDRDSGSLRMFQILSILYRLGHHVTFLPDNLADIPPYADELRKRGIEVVHYPHTKTVRDYLQREGAAFDVVILSRCDFARKHIAHVRQYAPQSRVIFDTVDLHFLREGRHAEMTGDPEIKRKAGEKQQIEYDLIDQADETWVVSPVERDLLRSSHPDVSISVLSNIVELPGSATPFSDRRDILFIGSFQHPPNTDAVLFFAKEIFPMVQARLPEVKFYIVGDKASPEVVSLATEDVIITGYQPDVAVFFNAIKLSVAPLRYGAGVKGKINQSMGFGVPVVATTIAAEGMSLTDGKDIMIADQPGEFAEKLIELYQSEELWQRISRNALLKTNELFSCEAARRQLEQLLNDDHSRNLSPSSVLASTLRKPVTAPISG
jgi:GT2 family glycosyltransferase/glycosyltransferase involved in cell wall biosynthesis